MVLLLCLKTSGRRPDRNTNPDAVELVQSAIGVLLCGLDCSVCIACQSNACYSLIPGRIRSVHIPAEDFGFSRCPSCVLTDVVGGEDDFLLRIWTLQPGK